MLGFNTCSDKIAAKAGDAFSGMKAKVNKGISDIEAGMNTRIGLLAKNTEEGDKLRADIAKDEANLRILRSKVEALDSLI